MRTIGGRFSLQHAVAMPFVVIALLTALVAAGAQPVQAQEAQDASVIGASVSQASGSSVPETDTPAIAALEVGTVVIDEGADHVIVPISINPGATPVAAFQFEIVFNADALTPTGCSHVSGFGVCAPKEDGRIELNAARVEGWATSTVVVELSFTVRESAAIRVGSVAGVWGTESSQLSEIDYDVVFGAVHVGEQQQESADQLPGGALVSGGAITGTASSGVHESGLYGAGVCALNEASHHARCSVTNSRGEFRIDGLTPGTYLIEYLGIDADRALHRISGVLVESGATAQGIDFDLRDPTIAIEVASADHTIVEAQTNASSATSSPFSDGEIVGSINDASGQPVAAVIVCATDIGVGTELCSASRLDGTFSIDGLHAGNYVVSVTDPGQRFGDTATSAFGFDATTVEQVDVTLTRS